MMKTERLQIRPFSAEDLDLIFQLYGNAEIMAYMPNDIMDRRAAAFHLKKILNDGQTLFPSNLEMVVSLPNGEKIGRCHIQLEKETESAMIGWLLRKEYWGRGYATEITMALLEYCFRVMELHRVYALCHPENTASCRVLEKCGMRREAYYKQKCRYVKQGKSSWQDELEYAILAEEFDV